ncbi:permease [Streptomyces roseochromogenus]|uniref:Membrane protein n=1 Tax=Streptomyces roseochromogenus subsp. oscitans DS 12.976 TaxID=1352936 RepID=V6L599_STRRC|nr:permease [Streptomyces roseochromogenus]EST36399.1 membrane protein [Streptomyces roseochromogenus subsp. oscitans DS 12.976]
MHAVLHALSIAGSMTWEITWALILGFALSAVVQAVVRKSTVVALLGDDRPRTLAVSAGLGVASSSCSYAAVALARSLFRKGANFTASMAFEIASTNLVVELGVILALLMGWQFTAAEFVGGPVMIVMLAVLFRLFLRAGLLRQAREQAERGLAGSMEGHAAMDMSVQRDGSFAGRLFSGEGFTATSHVFVMEWAAILRDLVAGLLIAGAIAAWVPDSFWRGFFFEGHPLATKLWGPVVGPLVAMASFVCSIGNVPLAVVLWKGGISFGGVVAFIFADLLILPIINIYRKYYGARMAAFLLGTFYLAMVIAGYIVEFAFGTLGLIPDQADAKVPMEGVSWNYTTWLNIAFLVLAAVFLVRFLRTGGPAMLRMMGGSPEMGHDRGDHMQHGHH